MVLSGVGAAGALIVGIYQWKTQAQTSRLHLAWNMTDELIKQKDTEISELRQRLLNSDARLTAQDQRMNEFDKRYQDCEKLRRDLEIQVAMLRLRMEERDAGT